jgi:hypothetical protein
LYAIFIFIFYSAVVVVVVIIINIIGTKEYINEKESNLN